MPEALLHPEFETLSASAVTAHQAELWPRQWAHVRRHSAFYRRKLGALAEREIGLDAISELPFTEKDELRLSQEAESPFGDYIAGDERRVVRLHRTSGTTGRPLYLANSRKDVELIARIGGRAQFCAGLRPGDRVVHCLNYCLWTGGVTDHLTLEETGACVIPFGVGNTRQLLETVAMLGVTAISCTPSYPALLEKLLREEGRDPRDLGLRLGLFGGEAGLDNYEFRDALEATWGFAVRNANYGMSEILSNFGSQCSHTNDLHFHGGDALFAELVDGEGKPLAIQEGTTGELVCTHLDKESQPLLRYKTRDLLTVTGTGACDCGRTTWRFRVTGRTDDMFNVRGVNVFPGAVQKGVLSRPDLASGQFRIVLEGAGPWDRIVVKAEAAAGLSPSRYAEAESLLGEAIRAQTGASAHVTILAPDSLPRTDGKTALIERK